MAWKLAVMILAIGATACGLLVLRQQELDLLGARTDLRREIGIKERQLRSLRWELNELSRDQRLLQWADRQEIDLESLEFEPRFEGPGHDPASGVDERFALDHAGAEGTRGG